jgi:hypothetical protein
MRTGPLTPAASRLVIPGLDPGTPAHSSIWTGPRVKPGDDEAGARDGALASPFVSWPGLARPPTTLPNPATQVRAKPGHGPAG